MQSQNQSHRAGTVLLSLGCLFSLIPWFLAFTVPMALLGSLLIALSALDIRTKILLNVLFYALPIGVYWAAFAQH